MEGGSNHRKELGKTGEDLACRYLESKGHRILERNYRSGHLEIDIISLDADGIHFVEVKTRRDSIQAPPQDNVGKVKQDRIVKAALKYLNSGKGKPDGDLECQFDVVAITFRTDKVDIEWLPNAFIPIYY